MNEREDDHWADDGPVNRPAIAVVMIGALAFGLALLIAIGAAILRVVELIAEAIRG